MTKHHYNGCILHGEQTFHSAADEFPVILIAEDIFG